MKYDYTDLECDTTTRVKEKLIYAYIFILRTKANDSILSYNKTKNI